MLETLSSYLKTKEEEAAGARAFIQIAMTALVA